MSCRDIISDRPRHYYSLSHQVGEGEDTAFPVGSRAGLLVVVVVVVVVVLVAVIVRTAGVVAGPH